MNICAQSIAVLSLCVYRSVLFQVVQHSIIIPVEDQSTIAHSFRTITEDRNQE